MKLRSILGALVSACLLLAGGGSPRADIYTWTDAQGVRHYSNRPPSDAPSPKVLFKEYPYDPDADRQSFDVRQREWEELIEQIEAEDRREAEQARLREQQSQSGQPQTLEERAAAERKRLEEQIAELEKKPLEYFGSFKNKRVRLGYYRYRLEALAQDPESYFNNPEPFVGNLKEGDADNR